MRKRESDILRVFSFQGEMGWRWIPPRPCFHRSPRRETAIIIILHAVGGWRVFIYLFSFFFDAIGARGSNVRRMGVRRSHRPGASKHVPTCA